MREIHNIVILTGAGISAESGLATFRGPEGLWEGHRVEDVATPEAFAAWVAEQKKPAIENPKAPSVAEGREVSLHSACVNCHTVSGTMANGRFGPDLTHVASRDTIASGAVNNNADNMKKWIDDPSSFKPGALMPPMHLNEHDLNAVTAYMMSLH